MVSQTRPLNQDTGAKPPSVRPMDLARDLGEIAHLIEVAFADELSPGGHFIMRELRLLHALRPLVWVLSRALPSFRDYMSGYVWEEDGKIVGNATISRVEGSNTQWIISNVAVLPTYRRRGIARTLVEAAIEHARKRHGVRILLQVRSDNLAARTLYEQMHFRYLESVTEMVAERVKATSFEEPPDVEVHEPVASRWYEAYEVARAAIPQPVQQIRPLRPQNFRIQEQSLIERVRAVLLAPPRERWWAERGANLLGLLTIDRRMGQLSERAELLIPPQGMNVVEAALVNKLSNRLRGRRDVRVSIMAELATARDLLLQAGFREIRTLDHMALELALVSQARCPARGAAAG